MTDNLLDDNVDHTELDPNKNYLADLVGEGKKFKTVEDLARGKYQADLFIDFKNKQFDEMRDDYLKTKEQLSTRASVESLVDELKQLKLTSSDNTNRANEVENQPKYDPKEVESLVSSKIQEHELTKKQQDNHNLVRGKIEERFGSNKSVLKQQISELGLTEEEVNYMARTKPEVLIRALGLDKQPVKDNFQAPVQSTKRNDNFAPRVEKRNYAYYQELKQKNLNEYLSPRNQTQMQKDAIEMGDSFFN